jgi:hypothetical protein
VRDGHKHFDEALASVQEAEQTSRSREAQMRELRMHASDVAALVSDGRLTLEAGMAELRERKQRIHQCLDAGRTSAARFATLAPQISVESYIEATALARELRRLAERFPTLLPERGGHAAR